MNVSDIMPVMLLLLFSFATSIGTAIIITVLRHARGRWAARQPDSPWPAACSCERTNFFRRPDCWLAIRSRNLLAVQSALGLHNPKPCSWSEGLAEDDKLFLTPPVKGWVLALGSGLPDPGDDVDACFRFVTELSRKVGQVQFFWANRVLHFHAWVRADSGRIVRAYAWAGRTLWKQGNQTRAERELGLKCYDYLEAPERTSFDQPDLPALNVDKVPLLAARWSLDPARIDEHFLEKGHGIAGELFRRF